MKTTTTTTIKHLLLVLLLLVAGALELAGQEAAAGADGDIAAVAETSDAIYGNTCIFVGCSCGEDDEQIAAAADDDADDDPLESVDLPSYDVSCRDEQRPALKLAEFPLRVDQQQQPTQKGRPFSNQVDTFDLSANELQEVPADRLRGLIIDMLDLSKNDITLVHGDAFHSVKRLGMLDLSYNTHLAKLNVSTFEPLGATLAQLKLSHCRLGEMDADKLSAALAPLASLRLLTLRQNHMAKLPDLHGLSKLEELSVATNHIETIVSAVDGSHLLPGSLIDLNLENNRLKKIDAHTFANLRHLKSMNLENNQIGVLDSAAFVHLTQLETLNLAKNQLRQIPPRVFFNLVRLERLDLSEQKSSLRQLDDYAFERHASAARPIGKIDLSSNRMTRLADKAFCARNNSKRAELQHPYANVREIDLSGNALGSLNACILRQLALGISDHVAKPSAITGLVGRRRRARTVRHLHHHLRPKISFKMSREQQLFPDDKSSTGSLKCDCEVTHAAHFVEFDGECDNSQQIAVPLRQFKCNGPSSAEEADKRCAKLEAFSCVELPPATIRDNGTKPPAPLTEPVATSTSAPTVADDNDDDDDDDGDDQEVVTPVVQTTTVAAFEKKEAVVVKTGDDGDSSRNSGQTVTATDSGSGNSRYAATTATSLLVSTLTATLVAVFSLL